MSFVVAVFRGAIVVAGAFLGVLYANKLDAETEAAKAKRDAQKAKRKAYDAKAKAHEDMMELAKTLLAWIILWGTVLVGCFFLISASQSVAFLSQAFAYLMIGVFFLAAAGGVIIVIRLLAAIYNAILS
eukprot:TRINITY_DN15667_c0_g1_i1.p2 TRINITY_DN15667_c0_g1~~TRINITY_DN15667_c0_g1_i1.p2  ORF type:complete len:129 (-),score=14.09 TRINITY_DN15667_c0_g1_i1:177-563(-)